MGLRSIKIIALLIALAALGSCGQKGDLYLPATHTSLSSFIHTV